MKGHEGCGRRLDQREFRPMAEVSFRLLVSLANVKRKETSDSKENTKHKKYDYPVH